MASSSAWQAPRGPIRYKPSMRIQLMILAATAAACGNVDAHQRQSALEADVAELEAEVGRLRATLAEAGVVKRKAAKKGAASPRRAGSRTPRFATPLPSPLSFEATRLGDSPALLPLTAPEATKGCGYRLQVPTLRGISDFALNKRGLGKASPVLLQLNGQPLSPHAYPAAYEGQCSGAFRHAGTAILFSPTSATDVQGASFDLTLDSRAGMPRGDDATPIYWAYPGTTLEVTVSGWDEAWGEPEAHVVLASTSALPIPVSIGDTETQALPNKVLAQALAGPPPWTIRIAPGNEEGYVALKELSVGSGQRGATLIEIGRP